MDSTIAFTTPNNNSHRWVELFEKSVSELIATADLSFFRDPVDLYAATLKNYLLGKNEKLLEIIDIIRSNLDSSEEQSAIYQLALIRYFIRKHELQSPEAQSHLNTLQDLQFLSPYLEAERYLVLAQAFENLRDHKQASENFTKSAQLFDACHCRKKACRARLNSLTNLTCLFPDSDYMEDYINLAEAALLVNETSTPSICWLNLSREFQKTNNLDMALCYCDKALLKSSSETGSLNFALIQCHKVDLLIDQKDTVKAKALLQDLKKYPFLQINENLKVLEAKLNKQLPKSINENFLLPTWLERWKSILTVFKGLPLRGHINE